MRRAVHAAGSQCSRALVPQRGAFLSTGAGGRDAWSQRRVVKLSPPERIALTVGSALTALSNPLRADMIATLGETTGEPVLRSMLQKLRADPEGRTLLATMPRIRSSVVEGWKARGFAPGTLGHAYLAFMDSHGFDADSRIDVKYIEDDELAFVLQRYREAHDILHPLCGLPPTVLGELGLKWFEMVQTGLPMTGLAAVFGGLRLESAERAVLFEHLVPWAASSARHARFVLTAPFEDMLDWPLDRVRQHLHLRPAPDVEELLTSVRQRGGILRRFAALGKALVPTKPR
jgi:ubiquinone biosynthesis protein COQ4